jgi:intracellular sulfur oxidation DsrE/DsrF family protein
VILNTLEDSIPVVEATEGSPIVVMLHGEEAHRFVRGNYQANKAIVDQTAKLAVIDVKICETWMRINNYERADLFPFVGTVPYGVTELERLETEEGYTEFGVSL